MKVHLGIIRMAIVLAVGVNSLKTGISLAEQTADQYYKEGIQLFNEGCQPDPGVEQKICRRAIEALEHALKINPGLTDALLTLSRAYWNTSFRGDESDEDLKTLRDKVSIFVKKAVALDPNHVDANYELVQYLDDKNKKIALLRKVIQLNSKHPWAHDLLARTLIEQQKMDEAFKQYMIHLEVSPYAVEYGSNHMYFARLLAQEGRLKEAVEIYDKTLIVLNGEPRRRRCDLFSSLDLEPYRAFKEFTDKVEKLRPYCTKMEHYNKAFRLQDQRKTDEAIEELQLQLKENPYYEDTYSILEDIYKERGQMEKALEIVKKSFAMIEGDPSEWCRRYWYQGLSRSVYDYEPLDKKFIAQLKQECEKRKN